MVLLPPDEHAIPAVDSSVHDGFIVLASVMLDGR